MNEHSAHTVLVYTAVSPLDFTVRRSTVYAHCPLEHSAYALYFISDSKVTNTILFQSNFDPIYLDYSHEH